MAKFEPDIQGDVLLVTKVNGVVYAKRPVTVKPKPVESYAKFVDLPVKCHQYR
jgi:hypothetical protein